MTIQYSGTSRADRLALALIADKANAQPSRGTHIGGGRHVPMPETWDGNGPVPPGWTSHRGTVDTTVFLADEPETATKLARLTAQEQTILAAARAAAETIAKEETNVASR